MRSSSAPAQMKPTIGENSSALPTFAACDQSTPLVPSRPCIKALATPTPMIEPTSVCEEEFGRPKYQVPRFQRMAAISSANTIANPAWLPTCKINSTGNSDTMLKATAPLENSTPRKLKKPDHTTATFGASEWV